MVVMDKNSLVFPVLIFAWIVLYGISIALAAILDSAVTAARDTTKAAAKELHINWKVLEKDAIKAWNQKPHRPMVSCWFISFLRYLPYFISVVPEFFPPYHGILDTALYILSFLILTRVMVWSVRKQGENREKR